MSDIFRKVLPGDKLRIPAAAYNASVDAARSQQGREHDRSADPKPADRRDSGIVLVKNASGADRQRFDVLSISGVVFSPSANLEAFQNRPVFIGVTPAAAAPGKFVVLLAPAKANAIAHAAVASLTVVRVNVTDASHGFADVKDNDATQLQSSASGTARILWREGGTGSQWALVRLGDAAGGASIPLGTLQGQVYQMLSDDTAGWDFIRASA